MGTGLFYMASSFQCESSRELKFHTEDSAEGAVCEVDTRVLPVTVCCCMDIGNVPLTVSHRLPW